MVAPKNSGTWFKKTGKEKKWFWLQNSRSKSNFNYMREKNDFSAASIKYALDNSLQRLQTDYIDLYQLHWPERKTNYFGQRGFKVQDDAWEDNIHAVLDTLDFYKAREDQAYGLSNETPWDSCVF
jgi:aryl-alcohol dehydrogenase-like predicted oxidoreductase